MDLPKKLFYLLLSLLFVTVHSQANYDFNSTEDHYTHSKSEVLSRKKRFLVFPEGSSLQLVFCVTVPTIFEIGDIFLFGSTAALAWELPQDPYSPFNHKADPLHRRMDTNIIYTDEAGKIIYKRPYERKLIVNPAFAKRSVDSPRDRSEVRTEDVKIDRKRMHNLQNKLVLNEASLEFHRNSRATLYQKIETLIQGLGGNGKQCVLKSLCLIGKSHHLPQGSFFEEVLRAVFTLPKTTHQIEDEYKEYDEAMSTTESCEERYSDCDEPLMDIDAPLVRY